MSSRGRKKASGNDKSQGRLHVTTSCSTTTQQVTVETLENGFMINVYQEKNSPGLLVKILEAFEELGLEVLDATVSCSDTFQLQAVGGEIEGNSHNINEQVVKQAVTQAIDNWSTESNGQKK